MGRQREQAVGVEQFGFDAELLFERDLPFEETHAGFAVGDHQAASHANLEILAAVSFELLP